MHQERRTMRRRKTKVSKKFALLMAAMPRGQQQPFVLVGQSFSHEMVSLLFHFMMAFCKKKKNFRRSLLGRFACRGREQEE